MLISADDLFYVIEKYPHCTVCFTTDDLIFVPKKWVDPNVPRRGTRKGVKMDRDSITRMCQTCGQRRKKDRKRNPLI